MACRAVPLAKPPRVGSRRHRVRADGPATAWRPPAPFSAIPDRDTVRRSRRRWLGTPAYALSNHDLSRATSRLIGPGDFVTSLAAGHTAEYRSVVDPEPTDAEPPRGAPALAQPATALIGESEEDNRGVLGRTGGTVIVAVVGAILIGVALVQGYKGVSRILGLRRRNQQIEGMMQTARCVRAGRRCDRPPPTPGAERAAAAVAFRVFWRTSSVGATDDRVAIRA